jgi:rubrerythrin
MTEGAGTGYQRLQSKKTLSEILEVATSFEQTARDFYASLAPKVSKNIRWLVEELAEEEQRHFDLFSELAARDDIERYVHQEVDTPASDRRFSDCVQTPDLGEHPDDQAVLQYALGREHAAMDQYRALAQAAHPGPLQELFEFLANEETKHKNELEKLYYQIVHSGGV